ncbi:toxin co-regulated pilus biosynthesis Q family protein [Mitsuaria sp. CC2]|uniref:toxin co-regulated pilus biosynthesis Q family protein n=1 Tax=Mitsuaria sp. CC2 TaxID=3029186 RepID=UPI003B8E7CFF
MVLSRLPRAAAPVPTLVLGVTILALSPGAAASPVPSSVPSSAAASVPSSATSSASGPSATATPAWAALTAESAGSWTFAHDDGTVHQALQRWAREAGWQLVWEVERDFPIDAEVALRGNFLDALTQAMTALRDTDFPLQARVQAETRVVRIGRYLPDGARR